MSDSELVTVGASLYIQVSLDCPHCCAHIDLLDSRTTNNHYHNDEGDVLNQACPDACWSTEHEKFEINDVTCTECQNTFNVKGLSW